MIYLVNFPFCNFYSLERYLRVRDLPYKILNSLHSPSPSDTIVLPGVGTFEQAMSYLQSQQLLRPLFSHVDSGGRLLGICLGMQILFEYSDESPNVAGLSLLTGYCESIPASSRFRVPHIGWNQLTLPPTSHSHLSLYDFNDDQPISSADYYFVHSYHVRPLSSSLISSCFDHPSGPLCASVGQNHIIGVQFHPEKSGYDGYALLDRLLGIQTTI